MINTNKPKPKFCYCCFEKSTNFCVDKTKKTHTLYGFCRSCIEDYSFAERRVKQRAFVFDAMKNTGLLTMFGEL